MVEHTKIDLCQLAKEIRAMKPGYKLYRVLKAELSRVDHWKGKRSGPVKGYQPRVMVQFEVDKLSGKLLSLKRE